MAGRIQGITVEIGGDTTKLQTALKGVNTEIGNTQSQLQDVDKLLKLDPGNTELLTQKRRLLGDAVKETKDKLETLKTAAVKTAADFDFAMSKVAAVSGATGSDLESLRNKAREMGEKTKFSASEAAEAMNYMAMAEWKTEDMLSDIEGVMNLAAASSNANTNVSMMGETFKYCAPITGALGFSAEDTAEATGLMANAGIKSSQAGTALRTIMNNLSRDVKICGSAIGEVTIATTNADGSMRNLSDILADCRTAFAGLTESEKAQAAESLVGKNAMSGFLALMNAGEGDIEKLSSAIANCDGTAASMAETMQDNLAGQLQILKSQLEELAISFGELLMPAVRTIMGWIQKSMIGKVGEAVSSVANKIRSFLHFSVPDEGPLTDYEKWMPDFIGGLARGD